MDQGGLRCVVGTRAKPPPAVDQWKGAHLPARPKSFRMRL